jgi:hypothetical protein
MTQTLYRLCTQGLPWYCGIPDIRCMKYLYLHVCCDDKKVIRGIGADGRRRRLSASKRGSHSN